MNLIKFSVTHYEINISPEIVAKLLSLDSQNIPEPYKSIISSELEKISDYNEICGGLRIIEKPQLNFDTNEVLLENVHFNPGRQVIKHLINSEKIVMYICTAGEGISKRSKDYNNSGDLLEGYICDVIGSLLVEEAMTIIHKRFTDKLIENLDKSTNRYSPGYCDWNVEEQHKLFSLFPEGFCGIRLSESALMHPLKSVSGIFGIGENVKFHKYVCNACGQTTCIYRNLKYAE
jgi:hypothetical protein